MDLSPSMPAAVSGEPPPVQSNCRDPAAARASAAAPPSVAGEETRVASPSEAEGGADELGVLTFPAGLPGFPDARAFRLRQLPGAAGFSLLESLEPDGPRFVVLDIAEPETVFGPAATAEAAAAFGIEVGDLLLLAIVTLTNGPAGRRAHVNLRAPVAVDRVGRTARQLVLADPGLPLRHPLEPRAAA
ncbi:MAG: hypothetical protein KatS3mg117_3414 [Geminicoccaceae bacterium]|nr:MAG: hypothetical protein KatS3mg117_3414 [Geminicoccaceae bacterium]